MNFESTYNDVKLPPPLSLRHEASGDEAGLLDLYCSVRGPEFAPMGLPAAMLRTLLQNQFSAQTMQYAATYPQMTRLILTDGAAIAGRILLADLEEAIRIVDISLKPEFRGKGIGTILLRTLLAQALVQKCEVRLSVYLNNPAQRLYQRLGFRDLGGNPYREMLWNPAAPPPAAANLR